MVILTHRVGFEANFGGAAGTPNIETINRYRIVSFVGGFLPGVEFSAFIYVFTAGSAFHTEGGHEPNGDYFWAGSFGNTSTSYLAENN